ncbi:NTP transferase domain-containing protein [Anoxynatronum sibiricum]|uniref:NTP transferase domain-containing protein n=1 Tax=Anoxynatronum sibiricum TaxID=210623 RepID=A0ABU9VXX4_9CLOT
MVVNYIVVQAGGKGTRLEHFTENKPKALCPIDNLPMLFHLFRKFPHKKFVIIGDYKKEVLEKYLEVFSNVEYLFVEADEKGTCGGVRKAMSWLPENQPLMLIWSDLVLGEKFSLDNLEEKNYVGLSKGFECRWSFAENVFTHKKSTIHGVAGVFIFKSKQLLDQVPTTGEFVKWLSQKEIQCEGLDLDGAREYGTVEAIRQRMSEHMRCRPFNKIQVCDNKVIKMPIDSQGEALSVNEKNWYRKVASQGYRQIPKIYSYDPLTMEKIKGINLFQTNLSREEKKTVIHKLIVTMKDLHNLEPSPRDYFSVYETYYTKTLKRIESVRRLIPFAENKEIVINGKACRNIFHHTDAFKQKVKEIMPDTHFSVIHGDCTFSNILVDEAMDIKLIDPRGYFGSLRVYGDSDYDWAKLYYSIYGDYDQFNNKNFQLSMDEKGAQLTIKTSGWRELSDYYLRSLGKVDTDKIKFLHAIIWLSLTTYTWEDYDAICAAFYNGIYYLDEFLR